MQNDGQNFGSGGIRFHESRVPGGVLHRGPTVRPRLSLHSWIAVRLGGSDLLRGTAS